MANNIAKLRKARGWTQEAAAERFGMSLGGYRHLEYGERGLKADRIQKASEVFGVPVNQIIGEDAVKTSGLTEQTYRISKVPVAGNVAAGLWVDDGDWDGWGYGNEVPVEIPTILGRYANIEQCAYKVIGDSMDRAGIAEGGYVVAVPYLLVREAITDGDLVIVVRRDSLRIERTVKRVRIDGNEYHLIPESNNPRHKKIVIQRGTFLHEHCEVEITGLVIGYYRPL